MYVDRDIFQNALDAIIILDASGVISEINPSALDLLRKRRKKAVGTRLEDFFEGDLTKKRGEVTLRKGRNILQYTKASGTNKKTQLYFFRDITDLKQEMLRREHFLGIAGHELKNPLATIKALNHMILMQKKVKEDSYLREQVQKVNTKTDVLTRLIVELLDVTKIKHNRLDLNLEEVRFNKILEEVIEDFHRINGTHKVEIHNKTNVKIKVDKVRIGQVIINLLKNAAKYSPTAGYVFLNVKLSKKYLVCEVIDFGVGMQPEDVNKVFDLYYRLPGREKTFDGLGVGLYIANEIVKAHGGKMKVKSAPDHGSQFIFYLPLKSKLKNSKFSFFSKN